MEFDKQKRFSQLLPSFLGLFKLMSTVYWNVHRRLRRFNSMPETDDLCKEQIRTNYANVREHDVKKTCKDDEEQRHDPFLLCFGRNGKSDNPKRFDIFTLFLILNKHWKMTNGGKVCSFLSHYFGDAAETENCEELQEFDIETLISSCDKSETEEDLPLLDTDADDSSIQKKSEFLVQQDSEIAFNSSLLADILNIKGKIVEVLILLELLSRYVKSPDEKAAKKLRELDSFVNSVDRKSLSLKEIEENLKEISHFVHSCATDDLDEKRSVSSDDADENNEDLRSRSDAYSVSSDPLPRDPCDPSLLQRHCMQQKQNFEDKKSGEKNVQNKFENYNDLSEKPRDASEGYERKTASSRDVKTKKCETSFKQEDRGRRRPMTPCADRKGDESWEKSEIPRTDIKHLEEENVTLKSQLQDFRNSFEILKQQLKEEKKKTKLLGSRLKDVENELRSLRDEYTKALEQLGRLTVEEASKVKKEEESQLFKETFHLDSSSSQKKQPGDKDGASTSKLISGKEKHGPLPKEKCLSTQTFIFSTSEEREVQGAEALIEENEFKQENKILTNGKKFSGFNHDKVPFSSAEESFENGNTTLSVQVEESNEGENLSLGPISLPSALTALKKNYNLLLLTVADLLLFDEIGKLINWASQRFFIEPYEDVKRVVFLLDEKKVISSSNFTELLEFLESILRFDLVYLIDAFLRGDYSVLWATSTSRRHEKSMKINQRSTLVPQRSDSERSRRLQNTAAPVSFSSSRTNIGISKRSSPFANTSTLANGNEVVSNYHHHCKAGSSRFFCSNPHEVVVEDGVHQKTGNNGGAQLNVGSKMSYQHSQPSFIYNVKNGQLADFGSNSKKLSKFSHSEPQNTNVRTSQANGISRNQPANSCVDEDENWLCSHYKRRCYVKFTCCDKFWPCHRCHNNKSTCGQKKLKSRDTVMVKCSKCGKEQQFGENGQYCCQCNAEFAKYYCGMCKHLTGLDDHPYHCDKCGICRIHGDRSYHCDVCGVCLDVQLRGNHKCRAGSAHDECCICLEDAFSGCQILPCSHKVHKECANQMVKNGITRCPICRESFLHKLERKSTHTSRRNGNGRWLNYRK